MMNKKRIGLSLSGGGYRAAAYHFGALIKLKQLGILENIDVISSISGGSITNAYFALNSDNFELFKKGLINGLKSNVINGVLLSPQFILVALVLLLVFGLIVGLLFTKWAWLSLILTIVTFSALFKYQFKLLPLSKMIEKMYRRYFFGEATLSELQDSHVFAINATNLETGRLFTFSKKKMEDSSYAYNYEPPIEFNNTHFPLARAVAASTCVPFAFTPIPIGKKYFKNKSQATKVKPMLVDGGVYDNQGIHKITQKGSSYECDIIITSDAGTTFQKERKYNNTIQLLIRTSDLFMHRIKNFQMVKNVFENVNTANKEIAYYSLGWDLNKCLDGFITNLKNDRITKEVIRAHQIKDEDIIQGRWEEIKKWIKNRIQYDKISNGYPDEAQVKLARSVKTNLTSLTDEQIHALVKHAGCMMEIQIKLYCPTLFF